MRSLPPSHRRVTPLKKFLYGAAYYPEHWPEAVRSSDPTWMKEAGFNCVRMGEFAWDLFEPKEGCFDFSFHAAVVEKLATHGIATILCTPTAAPPVWLVRRHPEILRINADGVRMEHGSRQHASLMSSVFRDYAKKITQALADHFRESLNVVGWQTDNEFHCHFSEDHSDAAQHAFRRFLRAKFNDDIDALNRAWGNSFWALTYFSFEEICTPRPGKPTWSNPAHVLDYSRFLSKAAAEFQSVQIQILRAANSGWFITHNGWFENIDYRGKFTKDLDFLSYDCYPFFEPQPSNRFFTQAFALDYTRSFSGNFMVLEQQSGPGGQGPFLHDTPEPGEMRRMAYSSLARGADGLLFFRERSCRFGAEEYWCGILDHDNVPRRRFQEAKKLGHELHILGPKLLGTWVHFDLGIAMGDFDAVAGHATISHGLPDPHTAARPIHRALLSSGYAVGGVHPSDDLSGLKAYFIPHYAVFKPEWLPNLSRFASNGGVVIIGARTGSRNCDNNVIASPLPGELSEIAGVTVEEFGRQNCVEERPLSFKLGRQIYKSTLDRGP
jgi:beta-galactosidase